VSAAGRAVVVVPGRLASDRLPRKLLLAESGRPLYAHVLERCRGARRADAVIAAVDGDELAAAAAGTGAQVVRTPPDLASGTDRVWAAVRDDPTVRLVVDVQGDEPEIEPEAVDAVFAALEDGAAAVTLAAPLPPERAGDPDCVKVVCDLAGRALYFSRAAVPHPRRPGGVAPRLHVGVYGFQREVLERFASWPPTPLERTEGLEQLRLLEHGVALTVLDWPRAFPGIDTRRDYDAFLERVGRAAPAPPPPPSP